MPNKVKTINRTGLVGEWLLDGNALDTAGTNNGTATNLTFTNTDRGYQSQCGVFNGSSSYVSITNNASLNLGTGDRTYAIRFKTSTNQSAKALFSTRTGTNTWVTINCNSNQIQFEQANSYPTNYKSVTYNVTYADGLWHELICQTSGSNIFIYYDNVLVVTDTWTPFSTDNTDEKTLGRYNVSNYFTGNIQSFRQFSRAISTQEIQTLYQEGLRQLSGQGYGSLFDGLVFQAESDFDNNIYDLIGSVAITRTAGTSTTDNFGTSNAISNPNYTWSSITYTTGYSFENSGSGWYLVTSPAGLSATGINRTTTLSKIFLFTRTLSASEVTALGNLCNSDSKVLPWKSNLPKSLQSGLVMWLNEQGKDLSGNGNNATLVNSPSVVRRIGEKGLSYNGSNQYLNIGSNLGWTSTSDFSFMCMVKVNANPSSGAQINILNLQETTNNTAFSILLYNSGGIVSVYGGKSRIGIQGEIGYTTNLVDGKYHLLVATSAGGNAQKLYLDGRLVASGSVSGNGAGGTAISGGNLGRRVNGDSYANVQIFNPFALNRTLSDLEIQQLFNSLYIK